MTTLDFSPAARLSAKTFGDEVTMRTWDTVRKYAPPEPGRPGPGLNHTLNRPLFFVWTMGSSFKGSVFNCLFPINACGWSTNAFADVLVRGKTQKLLKFPNKVGLVVISQVDGQPGHVMVEWKI